MSIRTRLVLSMGALVIVIMLCFLLVTVKRSTGREI